MYQKEPIKGTLGKTFAIVCEIKLVEFFKITQNTGRVKMWDRCKQRDHVNIAYDNGRIQLFQCQIERGERKLHGQGGNHL